MRSGFFRSVLIVARHELAEGIRTRRAVVVLILYLAGSVTATNGFISALNRIEEQVAEMLALAPGASTGAVADALWESRQFQRMITALVRDRDVARALFAVPPIALMYAWLAFTFTPILVMLTTSSRIASEIGTGSVRLVFLRTQRLAWAFGKFLGQSLVVIVALMLSVAGAWITARLRMDGLDGGAAAVGMIAYAGKAWIFSLSFVGLALGVSQTTRHPNLATVIGFVAWIAMRVLAWVAGRFEGDGVRELWHVARMITPHGHWVDLWRPDAAHVISATLFLSALGLVYLVIGHCILSRKDL